ITPGSHARTPRRSRCSPRRCRGFRRTRRRGSWAAACARGWDGRITLDKGHTMVDRGLWISWYNLPDDRRDDYLSWLYDSYIPRMVEKPRFLWAAHYASSKAPPMAHIRHTTDPPV